MFWCSWTSTCITITKNYDYTWCLYICCLLCLDIASLPSIFCNLEGGKMARLRFCFCTLVLLLSFCVSETRPLRNHDPISFHLPSNSLFLSTVKHYLYPGSEDRSLAKMDKLSTSAKVSFSIKWIRSSNATRSQYHQPLRVSPGGPDAHHHFKVTVSGEHGRR